MAKFEATERTQVRRLPKRGVYEKEEIYSILDEGFVCHLGFVVDGQPFAIPTGYVRVEDDIYVHGSPASRMLREVARGVDVCLTVTLVDGLVLARSAFHHSMNYRSVVVMGKARLLTDPQEKMRAMEGFTNHIVAGRWDEVRQPTERELKATSVLALAITEASAKVRVGPPIDDEEDYALPIWAGVLPLKTAMGAPVADARLGEKAPRLDAQRLKTRFDRYETR